MEQKPPIHALQWCKQ